MAKSLTIKNKNNLILYPKTVSSLVYNNNTGNTVKQDLDSLTAQVAQLSGVDNAFFGGVVGVSTDIATDYSNKGYSGTYFYMVGSDMSSLVAYQYSGSGSPIQLFSGATYDFTDYSDLKQEVATLSLKTEGISKRFNTSVARLLAAVLRKVAYIDTSVQDSANELIAILDAQASVLSISATYIGGQKYTGDTISVSDFSVNAIYDDNTSGSVTATSVSPTRLTSTSTQVTVTYNGKTTVVTVSATFNAVVSISDISTTQTDAVEGEPVDLSAITYTLHYANGNSVEMNDPNIITATPSTLNSGTNNITIALADDSTISGTLTINAGGAVTSATVLYPWASGETAGNSVEVLTRTIPTPLTAMPRYINITSVSAGGSATAYLIIDGEFQYDSTTNKWSGYVHRQSTTQKTFSDANISFEQDERGRYAEISIGPLAFDSTHNLVFRKDRRSYTITISDTIPTT